MFITYEQQIDIWKLTHLVKILNYGTYDVGTEIFDFFLFKVQTFA